MVNGCKIAGLAAAFALIVALLPQASAGGRAKAHHRHHPAKRADRCPTHRTAEGELVDCRGWRLRPGIGWDNTCFNLDYLPSQFACSPPGGRW